MGRCFVDDAAAASAARDFNLPRGASARFIAEAFAGSVKVPRRHARSLVSSSRQATKVAPAIRTSGSMLLVCRGKRVLSVRPLGLVELATLLTWAATGAWVPGGV